MTEKEAFEKVKEDFGQKQGLIKKIEKKLGVTHFEDINLKETGAKKATTADTLLVNINDARNLIKQRLIINIGVFITYLLVGFGLCGFAYLTFVQDIPVMAFNLTFEPWVAGLIVLGITLVFGILFFTLAGLNLYKAHDSIRIEKHELDNQAKEYVTRLSDSFKNTYFITSILSVVIAISSTLLLIGFVPYRIIIMFALNLLLFSLCILLGSYKKSFDLLLNKYEHSTNVGSITSFIEQISATVLPTLIIINMIGMFAFDAVLEMMVGLALTITALFVFVVYYENIRKLPLKRK